MTDLPKAVHQRPDQIAPGFCCLGMAYSCGHSSECMYDAAWVAAHERLHRFDWLPMALFYGSCVFALVVWVVTR